MKTSLIFLFSLVSIISNAKNDTIRCGDFIAFGKIVNEKKQGQWHFQKKNGNYFTTIAEGTYLNGEKTGEWIISANGLRYVLHYQNNLLSGKASVFVPYSQRERDKNSANGLKDGNVYTPNGKLVGEGKYVQGLKEGEWIYYHFNNGNTGVSAVQYFHLGIPTGTWKYYPYSLKRNSCYSGEMNAFGQNGYWIRTDTLFSIDHSQPASPGTIIGIYSDTSYYVNGLAEGYWHNNFCYGNYVHGKKEGEWTDITRRGSKTQEFKNGLLEGYDTLFGYNGLSVVFYSEGKLNGPVQDFSYDESGFHIIAEGLCAPNPQHRFDTENCKSIPVPAERIVELIEQGIGDSRLFELRDECRIFQSYRNENPQVFFFIPIDSLISRIKKRTYSGCNDSPFAMREEVRVGHWNYYWENGYKKEEGNHLPLVFDSLTHDETNQVEDPNNPGTFFLMPLTIENPIYYKTGWWNFYNEDGVMFRMELYDAYGKLVQRKDTLALGYQVYYRRNGNKKEEGLYKPLYYDDVLIDSTNQEEDPDNPGTFILVPKVIERPAYYKSGWWKIYNEDGKLIYEERYDEAGQNILLGTREYNEQGKLIHEVSYDKWGEIIEEKKY